jgi:hypothetical protein
MSPGIIALLQAIIGGIPRLIEAIKAGRDPGSIKLEDFISQDALDKVKAANQRAEDYIESG